MDMRPSITGLDKRLLCCALDTFTRFCNIHASQDQSRNMLQNHVSELKISRSFTLHLYFTWLTQIQDENEKSENSPYQRRQRTFPGLLYLFLLALYRLIFFFFYNPLSQ
ncbi:unnamed protein product [Lathyrus oleraceus]